MKPPCPDPCPLQDLMRNQLVQPKFKLLIYSNRIEILEPAVSLLMWLFLSGTWGGHVEDWNSEDWNEDVSQLIVMIM